MVAFEGLVSPVEIQQEYSLVAESHVDSGVGGVCNCNIKSRVQTHTGMDEQEGSELFSRIAFWSRIWST